MANIVIPTEDRKGKESRVAMHFGRCRTYTFLDEKGNVLKTIENTSEHMGGKSLPPELMKEHGADVLLCRGLGNRALSMCNQLGIDVYVCQADTVDEIFSRWKSSGLEKAGKEDTCGHEH